MVFLRPNADAVDGNWLNQAGSNVNLFDSLDETVAADTDYIQSPANPVNEICRIALSDPTGALSEPFVLRYRFNNIGGGQLTVRLLQGTTPIASWVETAAGWTTQERTLTSLQFAAMAGDYTDLFVEFTAAVAGPPSFATIFGTDLVAWYDASDAASITHSSGAVSQWNDKSGNGANLVQATSGNRPTYSATGLGGSQPSIEFHHDLQIFLATAAAAIATSGVTDFAVFAVGQMDDATDTYGAISSFLANGQETDFNNAGSGRILCRNNVDKGLSVYRTAQRGSKAISGYDTTFRSASVWSGGNHTMYVENVAGTPVTDSNGALAAAGALYVGCGVSSSAFVDFFDGHICEVAFVKVAPSSGQLSAVQAMLAAKWTV